MLKPFENTIAEHPKDAAMSISVGEDGSAGLVGAVGNLHAGLLVLFLLVAHSHHSSCLPFHGRARPSETGISPAVVWPMRKRARTRP